MAMGMAEIMALVTVLVVVVNVIVLVVGGGLGAVVVHGFGWFCKSLSRPCWNSQPNCYAPPDIKPKIFICRTKIAT